MNTNNNLVSNLKNISNSHNTFEKVFNIIIRRFISKKNKVRLCKLFIISLFLIPISIFVVESNNTYNHIINLIEKSNDLMIPLFTVTFTGYAIFQAFTSDNIVVSLLSVNIQNISQFEEFNISFFEVIMYYLMLISTNYLILSIGPIMFEAYVMNLSKKLYITNILPLIIHIYIFINMYALLEIRSFLFNIYQCFNMNAFTNGICALEKQKTK